MKLPSLKKEKIAQTPAVTLPKIEAAPKPKGLLKLFIPAIIASVLFAAAVLATAYLIVIVPQQQSSRSSMSKVHAGAYVNYLNQELQLVLDTLQHFSSDPSTAALFDSNQTEARELRETILSATVPYAKAVHIYQTGQAQANMDAATPVGYAAMDLVVRAEKGEEAPAEVHKTPKGQLLNIAIPIKQGSNVVGTLLAQIDFSSIVKNIPEMPANIGYLTWTQNSPGTAPVTLMTRGSDQWKTANPIFMNSSNPLWKITFYPSNELAETDVITPLLAVGALQLLLLFGLIALIYVRVKKELTGDALQFNNFSKQLLLQSNENIPAYFFDLFRYLSEQLLEFNQRMPQIRGAIEAKTSANVAMVKDRSEPSLDSIYQNNSTLDLDLGEDDNLFSSTMPPLPSPSLQQTPRTPAPTAQPMEFNSGPKVPAEIFRAYDIRGVFAQTLTIDAAVLIGQAIGSEVLSRGENIIVVARDGRLSSPALQQSLIRGILASGCDILDIGEVPTPVLYFATNVLNAQSGVMVTGSHNPPEHNGFKVVIGGEAISGEQILALHRRIEKNQFEKGEGYAQQIDVLPDYIERIISSAVLARPLKVVLDCGNGVGGSLGPRILTEMGCKVVELFCEVDGSFPNHQPDPSQPENLTALIEAVVANQADIGIALDGDADRIGVVTNHGTIIWPDRLLMLFARDVLSRNPGADVVFDVKCSRDVAELISSSGGRPIMWKSGHSLMKAKMRETGALLGGELSGHIFFADQWFGFDDGIYAAARLLEILSMEPIDAEELFAEFPAKASTPEFLIKIPEASKFNFMQRLEHSLKFNDGKIITIDGIRVDFTYGWGLIRASNTTASLTARFEGDSESSLKEIQRRFRDQLLAVDPSLQLPF